MKKVIRVEREYPYAIDKVWQAITSAEFVSKWLMPTDILPQVGHQFTFTTKPYPGFDGIVSCKVLSVVEPHEFAYSWSGGGLVNTTVTFNLEALSDRTTRLVFTHTGFEGLLNRLIARNVLASGWSGKVLSTQLPRVIGTL